LFINIVESVMKRKSELERSSWDYNAREAEDWIEDEVHIGAPIKTNEMRMMMSFEEREIFRVV